MNFFQINDFVGGWFIGNFSPAIENRDDFEVSVKYYKEGDKEARHLHKLAVEYTMIAKGRVKMNGQIIEAGTIVKIERNESTDFEVLEDTITVVVKTPSIKNDKYTL